MKKNILSSSLLCALLAGIAVTMQNSLNGMMTPFTGAMGASFIGFMVQMIIIGVILVVKKEKYPVKAIPFWCYGGGLIASITVGTIGYCVSVLGSAVTTCCSVTGQILFSAIIDHFGLFGNQKNSFSPSRIPGFVLILGGVIAINLLGGSGEQGISFPMMLVAVGLGFLAICVRTLNYKTTEISGSTLIGGMANSVSGSFFALIFFLVMSGFAFDFSVMSQVPGVCYLAGVCGVCSLLLNILAYKGKNIFYSTIFMLFGQFFTSIVMDLLVFHALSWGKCVGILIVLSGVLLDKYMTRSK